MSDSRVAVEALLRLRRNAGAHTSGASLDLPPNAERKVDLVGHVSLDRPLAGCYVNRASSGSVWSPRHADDSSDDPCMTARTPMDDQFLE